MAILVCCIFGMYPLSVQYLKCQSIIENRQKIANIYADEKGSD